MLQKLKNLGMSALGLFLWGIGSIFCLALYNIDVVVDILDHKLFYKDDGLLQQAKQGDDKAQVTLANNYYSGKHGFEKNKLLAIHWYKQAAKQGNAEAQDALGYSYLVGDKAVNNYPELAKIYLSSACNKGEKNACENLEKANPLPDLDVNQLKLLAKQGDVKAQFGLSTLYAQGIYTEHLFIPQDDEQAFHWTMQVAKINDDTYSPLANFNLGLDYVRGNSYVKQNKELAKMYFKLACDGGIELGCKNVKKL